MYANLNNNAKIVKLVCTKNNLLCVLNGNINILIKKNISANFEKKIFC